MGYSLIFGISARMRHAALRRRYCPETKMQPMKFESDFKQQGPRPHLALLKVTCLNHSHTQARYIQKAFKTT